MFVPVDIVVVEKWLQAIAADVKNGFDDRLGRCVAYRLAVSALAQDERQGAQDDGLARTGLAGDDGQPIVKPDVEFVDQRIVGDAEFAEAAEALKKSPSAFERWCDNRVIETIKPQKYEVCTVGPLVAYVLARQNEIKTARIVITGKANDLSEEAIRERTREMYV